MILAPVTPANWRLRPSAAPVWVRCAGHVSLALPDEDDASEQDNETREAGTACHWAAHMHAIGKPANVGDTAPNGVDIDDEMLDAVEMYHAAIAQWPVDRVWWEQPVHCRGIHVECGGTPDAFAYDPLHKVLYIADLKYGFRLVQPDSWQLICYVDGVLNHFGIDIQSIRKVVLTIVQPRKWTPKGYVRTWTGAPDEVLPRLGTLWAAAQRAMSPQPACTLNEGCFNCSGRVRCETYREASFNMLHSSYSAIPHDTSFEAAELELRHVQHALKMLGGMESGLKQQVQHAMKSGRRSLHFQLQSGETNLKWIMGSEDKIRTLGHVLGVEVNKPAQLKTPIQLKKVLGEKVIGMYAGRLKKSPDLVPADDTIIHRFFSEKPKT